MQKRRIIRSFIKNKYAVSEEFTTLPALSIVMVGFALFCVLFTQTYLTYEERMEQLHSYQTAYGIATKLTNSDCFFIRAGGCVDISVLQNNTEAFQALREQYERQGTSFLLRLHWNKITQDFPESLPINCSQRVAVTKNIGIYLNDAQTIPGSLTIILWRLF